MSESAPGTVPDADNNITFVLPGEFSTLSVGLSILASNKSERTIRDQVDQDLYVREQKKEKRVLVKANNII